MRVLVVIGVAVLCWLSTVTYATASQRVMITEVYPAPARGEQEWLELFNPGLATLDLTGWSIWDSLTSAKLIHQFGQVSIEPNATLVIEIDPAQFNNSGDGVELRDNSDLRVDYVEFGATQAGMSWSLDPTTDSFDWLKPNPGKFNPQATSVTPSVTIISTSPTPLPDYSSLSLSEVVACPSSDQDEWLELYNTSNQAIQLNNWQVIDSSDQSIPVSGFAAPNSYLVISWSRSLLNNSGDELMLRDEFGRKISEVTLPGCLPGQSLALISGQFTLTNQVSKGGSNPASLEPSPTPNPTLTPSLTPSISQTVASASDHQSRDSTDPSQAKTSYLPPLPKLNLEQALFPLTPLPQKVFLTGPAPRPWPWLSVIIGGVIISVGGGVIYVKNALSATDHSA